MSLLREAAELWWAWTAAMSLQIVLLVAIIGIADRLLARRVWPQLMAALWLVVAIKLVLPPTLASPISIARLGSAILPAGPATVAEPVGRQDVRVALFVACVTGCVALSSITVWRYHRLRSELLSGAVETVPAWLVEVAARMADRLHLRRVPDVRCARHDRGPAVVGFWRPVVVLPAAMLTSASRSYVEHVLLHEFAHVKRCDPLSNLACLVLQLLYWFHPAVWLVRARLATLREICCDQTVLSVLGELPDAYRRTLLDSARRLIEPSRPGWLGFFHRPSQLLTRLESLERPHCARCLGHRIATGAVAGVMLVCLVPMARPAGYSSRTIAGPTSELLGDDLPNWDELPGCLPRRFLVLGMLAKYDRAATPLDLASGATFSDYQENHP